MDSIYEILSLAAEPAFFVRQGVIGFANSGARGLLGGDCVGQKAEALLGQELGSPDAQSLVIQQRIAGAEYLLRVSRFEDGQLVFLDRRDDTPNLLNDAFIRCLRNNLMVLNAAADAIRPVAEDHRQRKILHDLRSLTASEFRLLRLEQNLSLARQLHEDVRTAPLAAKLDLTLQVHALLDAVEFHLPKLKIVRHIPSGLYLVADGQQLRQLLFNLISNALQHGKADTLYVSLNATPSHMLLSVGDNGAGVPEHELATVFSRYSLRREPLNAPGGVGLGLSAVRSVTQQHHGALMLESQAGKGTTVQASFARDLPIGNFGSGNELCTMRELLLGLAEVLPVEAFSERYMD